MCMVSTPWGRAIQSSTRRVANAYTRKAAQKIKRASERVEIFGWPAALTRSADCGGIASVAKGAVKPYSEFREGGNGGQSRARCGLRSGTEGRMCRTAEGAA